MGGEYLVIKTHVFFLFFYLNLFFNCFINIIRMKDSRIYNFFKSNRQVNQNVDFFNVHMEMLLPRERFMLTCANIYIKRVSKVPGLIHPT